MAEYDAPEKYDADMRRSAELEVSRRKNAPKRGEWHDFGMDEADRAHREMQRSAELGMEARRKRNGAKRTSSKR